MPRNGAIEAQITIPKKPAKSYIVDMFVEAKSRIGPNTLVVSAFDGVVKMFGGRIMLGKISVGKINFPV